MERRGFLRSSCRQCVGLAALATSGAAAAQEVNAFKMPSRLARPAIDTDEGGLWSLMDREETRLKRSPLAIRDAALTKYLTEVTCKLAGGHCPDVRAYAMRTPYFNASMAPNGMMQVWSGLLLRVENEAQLAAILGHELGHYLERHAVQQLRDAKDKAVLAQLVSLVGGIAGAVGRVGIMASLFSFSREHEMRADRAGMRLMQEAGYDGREAAKVWENLIGELKVTGGQGVGERSAMFATHPPPGNRRDDLRKLAGEQGGFLGRDELRAVIAPLRFGWIQDEIQRGQYEESLVLFDRLIASDAKDAQVRFARGEVLRLRADGDDVQQSVVELGLATQMEGAPAEAWCSLGLAHKQRGNTAAALQAFDKYLALAPQAADAGMVRSYLAEMKP